LSCHISNSINLISTLKCSNKVKFTNSSISIFNSYLSSNFTITLTIFDTKIIFIIILFFTFTANAKLTFSYCPDLRASVLECSIPILNSHYSMQFMEDPDHPVIRPGLPAGLQEESPLHGGVPLQGGGPRDCGDLLPLDTALRARKEGR
jgi:hypothetical protein